MPTFDDTAESTAPPEEVWKLLYDPARFPGWWAGIGSVERSGADDGYTMYPDGYPDFPMPQRLHGEPGVVVVSCLVSDLVFEWRLAPRGDGTVITVHVELPEAEAHRLPAQREAIGRSIRALAALAGHDPAPGT